MGGRVEEEVYQLEGLAENEISEMLGYREVYENWLPPPKGPKTESTKLERPWQEVISKRGYDFCVGYETGGKAYYEKIIKGKPIWPAYSSGITIGCGYDLGYHTLAQFRSDWGTRMPKAAFDRLAKTIGFRTTEPDRTVKVAKAKALVKSLSDVVVGWDVALEQFDNSKMPDLVGQLYRAVDNLDRLHPHCRGALLSLTFNRGAGVFSAAGDRYREGREIARLMKSGKPVDIRQIPDQLRSMKRIWGEGSSLSKRRDEEARLFEAGLTEEALLESLSFKAVPEGVKLEAAGKLFEDHSDVAEPTDIGEEPSDLNIQNEGFVLEGAGPDLSDVKWNSNDDEQPDYRHLPKTGASAAFDVTAEDIENLLSFNDFAVKPGLVVFALRGARIEGADKRENVSSVTISDIRPDHRAFRCVIGVLNRETKKLWAYKASTVPNAKAVLGCYRLHKAGKDLIGNTLPTGCYTYTVGTHKSGKPGEIKGVLRLSNASTGASKVVVLRSIDDVVYDRYDYWHATAPADNIHPGRTSTSFSSEGCLTLPGNYSKATMEHSGLWADFRKALGMKVKYANSDDGRQFSCVLLTGLDAAVAVRLRQNGDINNQAIADLALRRLRFGSQGARVSALQKMLGLAPDPSQLVGPVTRSELIKWQQKKMGWADGIWSEGGIG